MVFNSYEEMIEFAKELQINALKELNMTLTDNEAIAITLVGQRAFMDSDSKSAKAFDAHFTKQWFTNLLSKGKDRCRAAELKKLGAL